MLWPSVPALFTATSKVPYRPRGGHQHRGIPPQRGRCDHRPEMVHPAAHGLKGHQDPTFSQQILDVTEAQGEPDIKPDRLLDDFGREAVAAIADLGHHRWLWLKVTDGKPNGDVTMPRIDVLINNAGAMFSSCQLTCRVTVSGMHLGAHRRP
jgi:hypothetical protein